MSFPGLIGGLLFLILGLLELAVVNRLLYPGLRWRHEMAKTTQSQGLAPGRIMALVKLQSLIVLPVIGLLLGDRLKTLVG